MRSLWQLCNRYHSLSFILSGAALPASCYGLWWRQRTLALQYISTSTSANNSLAWEAPSRETLLRKIEGDMKDGNVDEAMQSFGDYKRLHGLPEPQVLNSVIVSLSYTCSRRWLLRAFDMVLSVYQVNSNLLNSGSLMRLALALARDQMPVPASTVLRIMLETKMLPDVNMLSMSFMHMVKSQVGSYLAADVLAETCECYLDHVTDRRQLKRLDPIKNNVTVFNIVLQSCVNFKCMIKAQKIMELMSSIGVLADLNTVIISSRVFEMVGQRDEMLHMKRSIDSLTYLPFLQYYQHFYDCLLSLHFKYNDMDAAAKLLIDLNQQQKSGVFFNNGMQKQGMIQIGSSNLKTGYKIMFDPGKVDKGLVLDTANHFGLVVRTDGKLLHSEKALAKLIVGCVNARNMHALCSVFITLHKGLERVCPLDVINACIKMGWLHAAHDILDHLQAAGMPVEISSYIHLLRAYEKENKLEEFNGLLQQIQKIASLMDNIHTNSLFTIKNIAKTVKDDMPLIKSSLFVTLLEERRHYNPRDHLTLEFNNSILFFSNAKMMEDALSTYKCMREQNIRPTCHTFCHILSGYSSMGMHREITILWGEIKRRVDFGDLDVDRDLLDSFVLNFLKGGYFTRVMEVIICMKNHNMYCDKWKYRHVFLKLHKNLFRNLSSLHDKTEAQNKRIEDVQAFRSWAGIK
ncbi:hypothetical protein QOZ80_7AG0572870 [Eleusine coracana subsp. coracana]|nr:hypothetical protein QOZ80_7AG0572870 [Eleusine coracana subsp. coracana]